jgi:hypothetical protein
MSGDIDEPGDKEQVENNLSEDDAPEDISEDEVSAEDIDLTADDDIISDGSTAEIKVDELVAKIDSEDPDEAAHHREVRQKLDALDEQRDDEFGSTYNFNIDEDL